MKHLCATLIAVFLWITCLTSLLFSQEIAKDSLKPWIPQDADIVAVVTPALLTKAPVSNYIAARLKDSTAKCVYLLLSDLKCTTPVYVVANSKRKQGVAIIKLDKSVSDIYTIAENVVKKHPVLFKDFKSLDDTGFSFSANKEVFAFKEYGKGEYLFGTQSEVVHFLNAKKGNNPELQSLFSKRLKTGTFCCVSTASKNDILSLTIFDTTIKGEDYVVVSMKTKPVKDLKLKREQYLVMMRFTAMAILGPKAIQPFLKDVKLSVKSEQTDMYYKMTPLFFTFIERAAGALKNAKLKM